MPEIASVVASRNKAVHGTYKFGASSITGLWEALRLLELLLLALLDYTGPCVNRLAQQRTYEPVPWTSGTA